MQAVDHNGVKVYDLCMGKTLPQWLSQKQKRVLRRDAEFRQRIELVQDFDFRTVSSCVRMASDGVHIVATGTYPPQVKVYDTRELSLKFERHLDAEVVQFEILSRDYTKLVFLGADRTLDFHAGYGSHHRVRVPRFGRDLAYDKFGCELFVGASDAEVYRLDLEQGTFLSPFKTSHNVGVNALHFCNGLQMLACGGADGTVSCWDARARTRVGLLQPSEQVEVTALQLDTSGMTMAVGTKHGQVSIYDVRSTRPVTSIQHPSDMAIVGIEFQRPGKLVLSSDAKAIRVWNRDTGASFVNIEPQADVNDLFLVSSTPSSESASPRTSGLIFAACEQEKMLSFYVPRLGPAPQWASFLDNLTEELEESSKGSADLYENYKFVTEADLEDLGVSNLLGTPLLRAYMHGYFMDTRLYKRIKAVSEPLEFKQWRKDKVQEKLEAKLGQRIARKKATNEPKVNKSFAERLRSKAAPDTQVVSEDSRFKAMFEDPDFEIDQDSEQFKQLYPSGLGETTKAGRDYDGSDDDGEYEPLASPAAEASPELKSEHKHKRKRAREPVALAASSVGDAGALLGVASRSGKKSGKPKRVARTLQEKISAEKSEDAVRLLPAGNMELSFIPKRDKASEDKAAASGEAKSKKGRRRRYR